MPGLGHGMGEPTPQPSSPGLTGGSSVLKDFLDSPVKPGNDAKKRHYSKVLKNDVDHEAPPFKVGRVHD